jgi:hypothetical protein
MSIDRRYRLIKSAIETSALGTGTQDSSTFLRGDGVWSNTILGQLGVGVAPFSTRGLTVKAPTAAEVAATFNSNAGVHSIIIRPNNSGTHNLVASDFESGSTYLPLVLSGDGGTHGITIAPAGNVTINAPTSGSTLKLAPGATNGELVATSAALTNNAGAAAGTLGNAPAAGNPTKWIKIDDNGTIRSIPAW